MFYVLYFAREFVMFLFSITLLYVMSHYTLNMLYSMTESSSIFESGDSV